MESYWLVRLWDGWVELQILELVLFPIPSWFWPQGWGGRNASSYPVLLPPYSLPLSWTVNQNENFLPFAAYQAFGESMKKTTANWLLEVRGLKQKGGVWRVTIIWQRSIPVGLSFFSFNWLHTLPGTLPIFHLKFSSGRMSFLHGIFYFHF